MVNNKSISFSLFGILFVYQIIGVCIHKQFGFGFFYWPVQEYFLLFLSLFVIWTNLEKFINFYKIGFLYHIYIFSIIAYLIVYLYSPSYSVHLSYDAKLDIFFETLKWYTISLAMGFTFKFLISELNIKSLTIVYFIIVFFFFAYILKLNHQDVMRAFIRGANFPSYEINEYLSASGYVKGFHLYFSPLFSIFSILYLYFLKNKKIPFFIVSILSIYILYLASGRGSLLAFTFSILLFMTKLKTKLIIVLIVIFTFLPLAAWLEEYNPRFYNLITFNLEDDPSARGRIMDFEHNMEYIKENLLVGGLRSYHEIGSAYIHSALAILQEYGIIIFSIFILMIFHSLYYLIKLKEHPQFIFIGAWLSYIVIDMALFKYVHEAKTMILFSIIYLYLISINRKAYA